MIIEGLAYAFNIDVIEKSKFFLFHETTLISLYQEFHNAY